MRVTVRRNVDFDPVTAERLEAEAKQRNLSVAALIRQLVTDGLKRLEEERREEERKRWEKYRKEL